MSDAEFEQNSDIDILYELKKLEEEQNGFTKIKRQLEKGFFGLDGNKTKTRRKRSSSKSSKFDI